MSDRTLADFPQGAFTAFSIAQMTYFLPVHPGLDDHSLTSFFREDTPNIRRTKNGLSLRLPNAPAVQAHNGQIIARFTNGKYKVIDTDYYHKNFNDPLLELD
ncbi:hypothetical protein ACFQ5J_07065 [Lacticaseibacillus baoqingensis]|uniref:Uncharacterized protein n=1 Tax=Lacticaseibacillus baoqingensis TaxID=2486013 RepID=A0ABW4E956_9LACO|nr:hypothetical protein [Lacticaseibacillus baoqingensis]